MSEQGCLLIDRKVPAGFFSDFFWILAGFHKAQELNLRPHVATKAGGLQSDLESGWTWEWVDYFAGIPVTECDSSHENLLALDPFDHPNPGIGELPLGDLLKLFLKYGGYRASTLNILKSQEQQIIEGRTLGVHYRSGDMRWAPSHPTPPSEELMLREMGKLLAESHFDSVFIASQDKKFIAKAMRRFPGVSIRHVSSDDLENVVEFSVLPKLAVLLDAYLLGRCSALLHSSSNVALAAKLLSSETLQSASEIHLGANSRNLLLAGIKGIPLWHVLRRWREKNVSLIQSRRKDWGL